MAWLDGWSKRIEITLGNYAGDIGASVTWFPVTVFLKPDVWVHPNSTYDDGDDWWGEEFAIDGNTGSFAGTNTINEPLELRLDSPISCDKIRIFSDDYLDDPETYYDLDVKIEVYYSGGWHTIHDGTVTHSEYVTVEIGSTQTVSKAQVTVNAISGGEIGLYEFDFNKLQGSEVFAELTTDGEYELMQFTEADGTSLLYGHMKVFDVSETKGIFTVSADGWTIDGNTSVFLYYDAGHAVNDTYIGATNTAACEAVYNPQYKAVYPMANGVDNAHIYDATSNNKDGTKEGANQPTETTGKVGQAQLFDVHYIETSLTGMDTYSYITMEFLIKPLGGSGVIFDWYEDDDNKGYLYYNAAIDRIQVSLKLGASWADNQIIDSEVLEDTYYLVTIVWNGSNTLAYIDGVSKTISFDTGNNTPLALSTITHTPFGTQRQTGAYLPNVDIALNVIIDESYISNSVRTPAWIKGTYNSLWDDLFTYGSEEEAPAEAVDNAVFFGCAF